MQFLAKFIDLFPYFRHFHKERGYIPANSTLFAIVFPEYKTLLDRFLMAYNTLFAGILPILYFASTPKKSNFLTCENERNVCNDRTLHTLPKSARTELFENDLSFLVCIQASYGLNNVKCEMYVFMRHA